MFVGRSVCVLACMHAYMCVCVAVGAGVGWQGVKAFYKHTKFQSLQNLFS